MKKLFILLSFIFLSACSNDSDETNNTPSDNILLKKTIYTEGSNTQTTDYFYENNKLLKIKETETGSFNYIHYLNFTYQGDKIIKMEEKDENNNSTGYYTLYNYTNDKLTQAIEYYNNQISETRNYNHISNSLITCTNDNGNTYSYYFDSNFNMIREEYSASHYTISTYDNYNNPWKNIVGFKAISIEGFFTGFRNNRLTHSETINGQTSIIDNVSYQYNSQDYPVLQTNEYGDITQAFYE